MWGMPAFAPLPGGLTRAAFTGDNFWEWFVDAPTKVLTTILLAALLRWALHRTITSVVNTAVKRNRARMDGRAGRAEQALAKAARLDHERYVQRAKTTGTVLRSIVTVTVSGIALLMVLSIVGLPLGPLLASAGVGGVAIGFGAQSLVKDFLSGIFMMVEDQYGVGDVIDTGSVVGTVEDVSLRITRLHDVDGVVWYVRNGEILRIGNRSQGWSTAIVDIPVHFDEKLERVLPIIKDVVAELDAEDEWRDRLLASPEVAGVESMAGGAITIRVTARCLPGQHLAVQREIRERVKAAFDTHGVRGPNLFVPGVPPAGGAR